MPNSWRIANDMGIKLHSRKQRNLHPGLPELPPKHSWSPKSIWHAGALAEKAGHPERVYDVLGLILASDANRRQLFGDVIIGVSLWAHAKRITTAEVPFLREAFCEVSLRDIRADVHRHGINEKPSQIALLISYHMEPALDAIRG